MAGIRWIATVEDEAHLPPLKEKLKHVDILIRLNYDDPSFMGASVELTNPETSDQLLEEIRSLTGVKVSPVRSVTKPDFEVSPVEDLEQAQDLLKREFIDPTTGLNYDSALDMTQVTKLHEAGHRGKGVKIAIIDTGIDYLHPDLGGCLGEECLVSHGYDFVGDKYNGHNTPVPGGDPRDLIGHGTHVAGIIAAQGKQWKFTGAAPEVTLSIYRVFGIKGTVETDILTAAFYKAYNEGANIITSSIGRPSGWSEDPWAEAVERIIRRGVPCIMPAGNRGEKGLFYASSGSSALGVYATGSTDNINTPKLKIPSNYSIDGGAPIAFEWARGKPYKSWDEVQDFEVYPLGFDTSAEDNGCFVEHYAKPYPDFSNKVVLMRRGGCEFLKKPYIATLVGAKYVIIYNNVPGSKQVDVSNAPSLRGFAMITPELGETWIKEIASGKNVTLNMAHPWKVIPNLSIEVNKESGGYMSNFSSWGPTWEMDLRPLVSVPGGNILSTYPQELGSYAVLSGTSMATPLLAAITALVGSVRGTFNPKVISSFIANYATPEKFNLGNGSGPSDFLAPVPQQGAGIVHAYDSAFGNTFFNQPYISFNSSDNFQESVSVEIINFSKIPIHYTVEHVPAITVYGKEPGNQIAFTPFPNNFEKAHASPTVSETEFTVGPLDFKLLTFTANPPEGLDPQRLPLWSGYFNFTCSDGAKLTLPYQGMTGSLKNTPQINELGTFLTFIPGNEAKPYDKLYHKAIKTTELFVLPKQGTNKAGHLKSDDLDLPGIEDHTRNKVAGVELPGMQIRLEIGSPLLRADLVPITWKYWFQTTRVLGVAIMGEHPHFPKYHATRGTRIYAFDGLLGDGRYAPPGEYKWLFRALKIGGDPKKSGDYNTFESTTFKITYEDMLKPEEVAAAREKVRPKLGYVIDPVDLGS
ncbi:hypothetical protein BROUX41_004200 [Berkeleyomyces rouxiae]|uniref:uncharacterized protein n=1 Tax=Berkeleyomyces rouxiae TaxID=2035830 RepID=UPI003B8266DD